MDEFTIIILLSLIRPVLRRVSLIVSCLVGRCIIFSDEIFLVFSPLNIKNTVLKMNMHHRRSFESLETKLLKLYHFKLNIITVEFLYHCTIYYIGQCSLGNTRMGIFDEML